MVVSFSLDRFRGDQSKPEIFLQEYALEVGLKIEAREIRLELVHDSLRLSYKVMGGMRKEYDD